MDIKSKTTERLVGEMKLLKIICFALIVVIILLIAISIYGLLTKEKTAVFTSLIVVGVSCGAMIPIQLININKIKKELASRS